MYRIYWYKGQGLLFGEYPTHDSAHEHMAWEHPEDDYTIVPTSTLFCADCGSIISSGMYCVVCVEKDVTDWRDA